MGKIISEVAVVIAGIICLYVVFSRKSLSAQEHNPGTGKTPIKITAADGKKMMDEGSVDVLLDVRTSEEFSSGHIHGAILIPDYEIEDKAPAQIPDKNSRIIVYCRSGRRSASAAKLLTILGYSKVYDMGGIVSWSYEIEK